MSDYGTVTAPLEVRFERLLPGPSEPSESSSSIRKSAANG